MAQRVRALAVLGEDPGSVLSTHMVIHSLCDTSFRESNALSWHPRASSMHGGAQIYQQTNGYACKIFFKKKKKTFFRQGLIM